MIYLLDLVGCFFNIVAKLSDHVLGLSGPGYQMKHNFKSICKHACCVRIVSLLRFKTTYLNISWEISFLLKRLGESCLESGMVASV